MTGSTKDYVLLSKLDHLLLRFVKGEALTSRQILEEVQLKNPHEAIAQLKRKGYKIASTQVTSTVNSAYVQNVYSMKM